MPRLRAQFFLTVMYGYGYGLGAYALVRPRGYTMPAKKTRPNGVGTTRFKQNQMRGVKEIRRIEQLKKNRLSRKYKKNGFRPIR